MTVEKGQKLKFNLTNEMKWLFSKLDKFTENELDRYILPHLLLGKLTLREMLFFTIYHIEHHEKLIKRNLK